MLRAVRRYLPWIGAVLAAEVVTITVPTSVALGFVAQTPTVSTSVTITVPNAIALGFAAQTPAVSTSVTVDWSDTPAPNQIALGFAAQTPTVGTEVTISVPSAMAFGWAAQTPTVTVASTIAVPTSTSLTFTFQTPTVSRESHAVDILNIEVTDSIALTFAFQTPSIWWTPGPTEHTPLAALDHESECDRCGFRYSIGKLRRQIGLMVCPMCYDEPSKLDEVYKDFER